MSLLEMWEKWKLYNAPANELRLLDRDQREELARDVGLSEGDFERLCGGRARSADELGLLMRALSLDAEQLEIENPGTVMRDMSVVCCGCQVVDRCWRELEAGSAAQNYRDYCPNAPTFGALLEAEAQSKLARRNRGRHD